jgi:hypothetical protein
MSEEALEEITIGNDRGKVIPVATSARDTYDFKTIQKERILRMSIIRGIIRG